MDYSKIYYKNDLKLQALNSKLNSVNKHLLKHPADYQARCASVVLSSIIRDKEIELEQINYLARIQQYR